MMISKDEVKKIALLARIGLSDDEVNKFQDELSQVIDYNAKELAKVKNKVKLVLDGSPSLGAKDDPRPFLPIDLALANAPAKDKEFFIVPQVLEEK